MTLHLAFVRRIAKWKSLSFRVVEEKRELSVEADFRTGLPRALRYDSRNIGKIEQAKCLAGLTSLSTCDRPSSAARQDASNEHVFVSIQDMTLFGPLYRGISPPQGRYLLQGGGKILPVALLEGRILPQYGHALAPKYLRGDIDNRRSGDNVVAARTALSKSGNDELDSAALGSRGCM